MKAPIVINNEIIDVEKISFLSAIDKNIKHDIKKASITFFFNLVVDGHLITIRNDSDTALAADREKICTILLQSEKNT